MTRLMQARSINKTFTDATIGMLNIINVDGETMEYILNNVGMREQMLRQLVMGATDEQLNILIEEKRELAKNVKEQMIDIFINGEWDCSFQTTNDVIIYNVGEVERIKLGDYEEYVSRMELSWDCYLCPAMFSHPDWSGHFRFK